MSVQTSFPTASTLPASPRIRPVVRRFLVVVAILLVPIAVYAAPRAAAPAPAIGNPLGGISRTAADLAPVTGTVAERLAAGGYTYLAVRRDDGTVVWTVTMGAGAAAGARVEVRSFGRQTNFVSKRLHRTFPELVFGLVSVRP